jgi:iron-sulfur cluster repair protein YtfE (RIC family)
MTDTKTAAPVVSLTFGFVDSLWSINTLLEHYPQVKPVLDTYHIDTCCGGALPIEEVAVRHKIDLTVLVEALERSAKAARV